MDSFKVWGSFKFDVSFLDSDADDEEFEEECPETPKVGMMVGGFSNNR